MNHPLQKLDVAARAAVQQEAEQPQLTADAHARASKTALKTVGGFSVHDTEAEEASRTASLAERREHAKTYTADTNRLKTKLEELGVEPLGFAPAKAWDFICRESGLYRMCFSDNGTIRAQRLFAPTRNPWVVTAMWFFTTGLIATAVFYATIAASYLPYMNTNWGNGYSPTIALGTITGVIALMAVFIDTMDGSNIPRFVLSLIERTFITVRLKCMPHEERLRRLMPKGISVGHNRPFFDPSISSGSISDFEVSVVLPEPPEDIRKTLLKLQPISKQIEVAAEAGAIGFMPPLEEQVLADVKVGQAERMEEARRRASMLMDPIITVREGSAVALVAQFGDFPIEEEVMLRGIASEHLL